MAQDRESYIGQPIRRDNDECVIWSHTQVVWMDGR